MSAKPVLGLLVIGQSPRPDLEAEFRRVVGEGCEIRVLGALDHLSEAEIAAHPPASGADTLYTTLPSGRSTLISKKLATEGLTKRLGDLRALGARASVLCCTGRFPSLETDGVISASDALGAAVLAATQPSTRLGIFIPKPEQADGARERWRAAGREAVVIPLSPDASEAEIDAAAEAMRAEAPDLVAYDCISYKHPLRQRAEAVHGAPGLVAAGVAARLAAELLGL